MKTKSILLSYLKSNKKLFIFIGATYLILLFTFLLYHLPLEAVIYPLFLTIFNLIVYLSIDYFKFKSKHEKLFSLGTLSAQLLPALSPPETLVEEDLLRIISNLKTENTNIESKLSQKQKDLNDYYTLWIHQIKTPIAAMELKLENEDSEFSRSLKPDLLKIRQYADMVLAYLRLSSEVSDFTFKETEIDPIIKESLIKFAPEFILRNIELDYTPVKITATTDEKWLSFVFDQIISNALKYTPAGKIKISSEEVDTLTISDTGIGIRDEDLPRIFEKGYTGLNGRIDKRASGIGLYLTKKILDKLNTKIEVNSESGKGTQVKLYLGKENLTKM